LVTAFAFADKCCFNELLSDMRNFVKCSFLGHPSSTVGSAHTLPDVDRPRNYYKCFVSCDIEAEIIRVCQLLGYYGDLQLLVDHFLELFAKSTIYHKQAAFCLNEIITGTIRPPTVTWDHTEAKTTTTTDIDCIVRYL